MKKSFLMMAIPLSVSIMGSSYAAQENPTKFEEQLIATAQTYLDKSEYSQICTQMFAEPIPAENNPLISPEELNYFQAQGLVEKKDDNYVFTDKAEPFVKRDDEKKVARLCFASPKVTAIAGVPSEDQIGEQKSLRTMITLEPQNVADWVKLPEFVEVFPIFKEMFAQPSKMQGPATFEKTEDGWVLRGLR